MNKASYLIAALTLGMAGGISDAVSASTITTNQGDACFASGGCVAVSAARSNAAAITDGNASTFFSLGVGGSITVDVAPLIFDGDIFAIEITNGNPNNSYPESAIFSFTGVSPTANIRVDNLGNNFTGTNGVTATSANAGSQTVLTIMLGTNSFNMLTITDNTLNDYAGSYANKRSDGFDLGELTFAAEPLNQVPAPGAIALLGLGMLGMGALRRSR